jgi:hypothetical protein
MKSLLKYSLSTVFITLALREGSTALAAEATIQKVDAIAVTVADMERSVAFYRDVLNFTLVADVEVAGPDYEHLYGVFGVRMRQVTLTLGDETLLLEQFIAPRGRPIPACSTTATASAYISRVKAKITVLSRSI